MSSEPYEELISLLVNLVKWSFTTSEPRKMILYYKWTS